MFKNKKDMLAYFLAWEKRGRGRHVFSQLVDIEPPCIPFVGFGPPKTDQQLNDDTRQTHRSIFPQRYSLNIFENPEERELIAPEELYPIIPNLFSEKKTALTEIQVSFQQRTLSNLSLLTDFLQIIAQTNTLIAFEIIGTAKTIVVQFTCRRLVAELVVKQLRAFFPDAILKREQKYLIGLWPPRKSKIIELALKQEYMLPLVMPQQLEPDPLIGVFGILEALENKELGGVQILLQGTKANWRDHILQTINDPKGKSLFADRPNFRDLTNTKVKYPLLAVIIRTFGQGRTAEDSERIAKELAKSLITTTNAVGSNQLAIIKNTTISYKDQLTDLLLRRSRRLGMLLNTRELITLLHFPGPSIHSKKLLQLRRTKEAPILTTSQDYILGLNEHQGISRSFALPIKNRLKHIHILGKTGQGKSTLLVNLITQDITAGNGVAVFDPHGDLITDILARTPVDKKDKVVLIDLADYDYAVGVNLLEAHQPLIKSRLISDLLVVFERFTTAWGTNMQHVLRKALQAFSKNTKVGTIYDLYLFLTNPRFRNNFLETVNDTDLINYWRDEFPKTKNSGAGRVAQRIDTLLSSSDTVRYTLSQKHGLDFRQLIDQGYIILLSLTTAVDDATRFFLGSLLLRRLYLAGMSRQDIPKEQRKPFFIYLDEFQNFVTSDMGKMLSEIRKYGVGVVLAHQFMHQIKGQDNSVAASVLINPNTRICFNLGTPDAKQLVDMFPEFTVQDLITLRPGNVIVSSDGYDFTLSFPKPTAIPKNLAKKRLTTHIETSRKNYAQKVIDIAEQLNKLKSPASQKPLIPVKTPKPQSQTNLQTEHLTIHQQVRVWAEAIGKELNLSLDPEARTPNQNGFVDLLLTGEGLTIAIEINSSNRLPYEAKNIKKCIKAGYDWVIWFCDSESKHEKMGDIIAESSNTNYSQVFFVRTKSELRDIITHCARGIQKEKTTFSLDFTPRQDYSASLSTFLTVMKKLYNGPNN